MKINKELFQQGGIVPNRLTKYDNIMMDNKNVPFIHRLITSDIRSIQDPYNKNNKSTHLLSSFDNMVVPQVFDNGMALGKLQFNGSNNIDPQFNTGNILKFKTEKEATDFGINYKQSEIWKAFAKKGKFQQGGKYDIQKINYNNVYEPIEDKISKVVDKIGYKNLPVSTQNFLNDTFGQFVINNKRNIPPIDNTIKDAQQELLKLNDNELQAFLKKDWTKTKSILDVYKNIPKSMSMFHAIKYYNHFHNLQNKGYTMKEGGKLKFL